MLIVTTPAADLSLLTDVQLRAAAGVSDDSQDDALSDAGLRIAASIARACNVSQGGANVPTLRLEGLTETIQVGGGHGHRMYGRGHGRHHMHGHQLVLSRRPVVTVTSITIDEVVLDPAHYEVDGAAGIVNHLRAYSPYCWGRHVTVVYTAGWDTVPPDLALAASLSLKATWLDANRDPNVKAVQVEGVDRREYFYGSDKDPMMSAQIMDLLKPYTQLRVA